MRSNQCSYTASQIFFQISNAEHTRQQNSNCGQSISVQKCDFCSTFANSCLWNLIQMRNLLLLAFSLIPGTRSGCKCKPSLQKHYKYKIQVQMQIQMQLQMQQLLLRAFNCIPISGTRSRCKCKYKYKSNNYFLKHINIVYPISGSQSKSKCSPACKKACPDVLNVHILKLRYNLSVIHMEIFILFSLFRRKCTFLCMWRKL